MTIFRVALSAFTFLLLSSFPCFSEPLPVVVTLPVLKDFTEQIGRGHVTVKSLITGLESEHTYTPKPSDMIAIKKARLLVRIGLGLEVWVKALIRNADRPDLAIVTTSDAIPLIQDAHSDGHPHGTKGNPHIWLDPENAKIMIRHITEGLIRLDPAHQEDYLRNQLNYVAQLDQLTLDLVSKVAALPNRGIITHHPAWPYFARRFGFVIEGNLLTQVGSEPSAKWIGALIQKIRDKRIKAIVSEPQLSSKIPKTLAEETGARIVILSPLTGAIPGTDSYMALIRYNTEALITALKAAS